MCVGDIFWLMRILFVFNHPAPYKINLLNAIAKEHDLDVIFERTSNSNRPKDFYYKNEYNFNYKFLKGIYFGDENHFSFALKNYIKHNHKNYDLIMMNGYSTISEIIAINYMIKHKIKYVLYINGGVIHKVEKKFKKNLKTKLVSNASIYFSPCLKSNEFLLYYGAKKENIYNYVYSTIYESNILLAPLTKEEKKHERELNHINNDFDHYFVTFGQFIDRKNNMLLLELFAKLPSNNHLTLVGSGEEENKYKEFIKENNLGKQVTIIPFKKQPNLLKFLHCFDYFISLSKEDIYGHMINEALSQGLPVIASNRIVSSYNLIKNNINGFIVDNIEQDEILQIMKDYIKDINPATCLKTAKENTIEKMIQSHLEILKELEK